MRRLALGWFARSAVARPLAFLSLTLALLIAFPALRFATDDQGWMLFSVIPIALFGMMFGLPGGVTAATISSVAYLAFADGKRLRHYRGTGTPLGISSSAWSRGSMRRAPSATSTCTRWRGVPAARRDSQSRDRHPLPAARRGALRRCDRARGAGALAAPDSRPARARRVRPARRSGRADDLGADRPCRRNGPGGRVEPVERGVAPCRRDRPVCPQTWTARISPRSFRAACANTAARPAG